MGVSNTHEMISVSTNALAPCVTNHCSDVIMSTMASQITSLIIVYPIVYSVRSKKTSKLRVTGLCAGNSPVTGEFPAQRTSNAKMFPFDDVMLISSQYVDWPKSKTRKLAKYVSLQGAFLKIIKSEIRPILRMEIWNPIQFLVVIWGMKLVSSIILHVPGKKPWRNWIASHNLVNKFLS